MRVFSISSSALLATLLSGTALAGGPATADGVGGTVGPSRVVGDRQGGLGAIAA